MRLLDARKLELVDVLDDEIPPYAILSHTWGDEEITLQDLHHMKGRMPSPLDKRKRAIADKEGFMKIKDAASLAVNRGLSYIWVDTCCIDKSSSAELSEAINSMYLWYQQSQECYAYLSDVNSSKDEALEWDYSSLRRSRWFRRGWTLQELIAPKAVHFYARDWSLLGHKDCPFPFVKIISELTGIDAEVLDGRTDPLQLSIAARMKWASHRETTRLEDMAYCLMGLFQVNMPLLYGEGRRAFTRLQEEIIQRTDDQSIYAWNSFDSAEEDPDALSGLFAQSLEQFRSAGNIQTLPPSPLHASAPSGTTNQGLRIQLYLRRILEADGAPMEEDYYAILDCFIQVGDLYECPVIRLRRLSQDQYARFLTKSRMFLPPMRAEFQDPEFEGYRSIYVRQQPVYYHLPQFRISPLHMRSQLDLHNKNRPDYKLMEIFPPRQWNSKTMTMRVKYSRKLQAMGVFRFQSPDTHEKIVDVVVGVRRLDAMQWEGWCFQRSSQGDQLELTLTFINQHISELTKRNTALISPGILGDLFGADSRLSTEATVEGIQLQGRFYVSISISRKPEIQTSAEVKPSASGLFYPPPNGPIRIPFLRYFQVRTLTGPCCHTYTPNGSVLPYTANPISPLAVRGRPLTFSALVEYKGCSDESIFKAYEFMKPLEPLHDFLAQVLKRKEEGVLSEALDDLAQALFFGKSDEIENLLKDDMGIDLNAQTGDPYGLASLHWAVAGGFAASIEAVLKKGASTLSVTREGWNALHVSAIFNKPAWKAITAWPSSCPISSEDLEKLVSHRTKDHFETPLHLAAAHGSSEMGLSIFNDLSRNVVTLATPFARNKYDETTLHRAAACNNIDIIRSIVLQCNDYTSYFINVVDRYGRTPLWHAAATGSLDAVRHLLSLNASINLTDDLGRSPLHAACRGGHHETVKYLLQEGARQSSETSILDLTALDYAALFGHIECIRYLLHSLDRNRAILNTAGFPVQHRALHFAASCGWLDCVKLLCTWGADHRKTHHYHLFLDQGKNFALVAEKEGDVVSASTHEGRTAIIEYLKTVGDYISMPLQTPAPAYIQPGAPEEREYAQVHPGAAFQASLPLQGYQPPPTNDQSSNSRYTSDPIVARPSAPFVKNPPSRVGSQSVTLPAYPTPYQRINPSSTSHNSIQSSYQPQSSWAPSSMSGQYSLGNSDSIPYRRGSTIPPYPAETYDLEAYSPSMPGPNRYTSNRGRPLPYPAESDERHLSIPDPGQATSVRANLVRMLGSIGNSSMLVEDSPVREYVRPVGEAGDRFQIYELAATNHVPT